MSADQTKTFIDREYQWGFVTSVEAETAPKGLNEDIPKPDV